MGEPVRSFPLRWAQEPLLLLCVIDSRRYQDGIMTRAGKKTAYYGGIWLCVNLWSHVVSCTLLPYACISNQTQIPRPPSRRGSHGPKLQPSLPVSVRAQKYICNVYYITQKNPTRNISRPLSPRPLATLLRQKHADEYHKTYSSFEISTYKHSKNLPHMTHFRKSGRRFTQDNLNLSPSPNPKPTPQVLVVPAAYMLLLANKIRYLVFFTPRYPS